jgi:uncharacterized protein YfaP (DUF2135 family)
MVSAAGLAFFAACHGPSSPSDQGTTNPPSTSALQVTATWDTGADVDLHVIEPSGVEIYWANPGPTPSGGVLDADANQECKTSSAGSKEVVHWNAGGPNGTYIVRLDYYASCNAAATNYTVLISDGKTTLPTVTGQLTGIGDVGNTSGTLVRTFVRNGNSLTRLTPSKALEPPSVLATLFGRG